jgi:CheY-specific phosphatase CheX
MTMQDVERDQLIDAVTRVAERSLFAFAEPVPASMTSGAVDGGWHVASVSFTGPFSGRMSLAVPVVLGQSICAAFLGDDEVDDAEAVRDLVGEFANMTCGTWLTAREERGCFDLAQPIVSDAARVAAGDLAFVINDMPVQVSLEIQP